MSVRQSRKGVSAFITWKSTRLIGVLTIINPIDIANPIPN
jgi:hypothetical protein